MRNILKYLKIVFIVTLIFGISIPSFCVMTREGESFLTKAEFDSALADFNGRLSSFEATINSKIDTQVSTYLDRNGIWSGKVQTRNEIGSIGEFKAGDVSVASGGRSTYKWTMKEYIPNINKSGLLVGKWYWKSKSNAGSANVRFGWYGQKMNDADKPTESSFFISAMLYEKKYGSSTNDLIYTSTFLSGIGRMPSNGDEGLRNYICYAPLCNEKIYYPLQVFVTGKSTLNWQIECTYRFPAVSSIAATTGDPSTIYIEWETPKIY